jgi:hypothetical protein
LDGPRIGAIKGNRWRRSRRSGRGLIGRDATADCYRKNHIKGFRYRGPHHDFSGSGGWVIHDGHRANVKRAQATQTCRLSPALGDLACRESLADRGKTRVSVAIVEFVRVAGLSDDDEPLCRRPGEKSIIRSGTDLAPVNSSWSLHPARQNYPVRYGLLEPLIFVCSAIVTDGSGSRRRARMLMITSADRTPSRSGFRQAASTAGSPSLASYSAPSIASRAQPSRIGLVMYARVRIFRSSWTEIASWKAFRSRKGPRLSSPGSVYPEASACGFVGRGLPAASSSCRAIADLRGKSLVAPRLTASVRSDTSQPNRPHHDR